MRARREEDQEEENTFPDRLTHRSFRTAPAEFVDVAAAKAAIRAKWDGFYLPRLNSVRNQSLLTGVRVQTWEEKQQTFIEAVEKEKYLVTILFGIISLVAVLLVGCIFYMIVQQKTRDIGIVKSVGATSLGVAGIFVSYGAAVGVVGGAIGTVIGVLFVHYINEIQDLLVDQPEGGGLEPAGLHL